ncbi:MAG TPA: hypothetical protein VI462_11405 [Acidimicrobiia bacterium]
MIRFFRWLAWTHWRLSHGSRFWAYVSIGTSALHAVARLLREPEARATIELRRGEALEVRVLDHDAR